MEKLHSKEYFEDVSNQWDQMSESFFGDAPRTAIYNHLNLRPGMSIADIGTGSGYLLEGLKGKDLDLIAIDQSPEMIKIVSEKLKKESLKALVGSSESLPLEDESVDAVVANMYLHHVERPELAIEEMSRVLKKGGQLIFTDLDSHEYEELVEEQFDRWMGFERSDVFSWMENAGLQTVKIDCLGAQCCTKSSSGKDIAISIFKASGIKI